MINVPVAMTDNLKIEVRKYPYPYQAMLAICSDLDETPDRQTYWEIMRFLNTTEATAMGPGVGLEVGNSIYFDMPPDQFAYWNTDDAGREMIRTLIRSGHVDCLHSYGDLATTRRHVGRALDELDRFSCRVPVWVDHSKAPTNLGADIMLGQGDVTGSPAYHADLTMAHGVKYVWRGRVTSLIGQDVQPSFRGVLTARHPVASVRTVLKEGAKHVLARRGHAKYQMHGPNKVLRSIQLRDGQPAMEFLRCNPHWGGVSWGDTSSGLAEVLTDRFLDRLVLREGVCILYTHLGKVRGRPQPFPEPARRALRRLSDHQSAGRTLMTTTFRLLQYLHMRDNIRYGAARQGDRMVIEIQQMQDAVGGSRLLSPDELGGLTFEVAWRGQVDVRLEGQPIRCRKVPSGEFSLVSVPWPSLTFPAGGM